MPYDAVTKETDAASVSGPTNNQVYTNPKFLVNIVTGASGDKEGETPCVVNVLPPSVTCDVDYGCEYQNGAQPFMRPWRCTRLRYVMRLHPPTPTTPTDGIWTAIDANTATWSFKSVKQDFFGPANYTDNLTIKKAALRRGE